jgi:hypothetical protein
LSFIAGAELVPTVAFTLVSVAFVFAWMGKIDAQATVGQLQSTLAQERADRAAETLAQERADRAAEALVQSEKARSTEAAWQARHQEITRDAQTKSRALDADRAAGLAAADGLRQRAAQLAAGNSAASDTDVAAFGPPDASRTAMLADVLARVEAAGRELAAIADARGMAGAACERAYDALQAP